MTPDTSTASPHPDASRGPSGGGLPPITVGQIWRDTHGDKNSRNKGRLNGRTVRVVKLGDDGRWSVVTVTGTGGGVPRNIRITQVSEKTLRAGYVLHEHARTSPSPSPAGADGAAAGGGTA